MLCGDIVARSQTPPADALVIIRRTVSRYENLSSYEDSGLVRLVPGDAAPAVNSNSGFQENTLVSFRTHYVRPGRFRFDWKSFSFKGPREATIWSDGRSSYSWRPSPGSQNGEFTYGRASLLFFMEEARSSSAGAIYFVPSLLMRNMSYMPFADLLSLIKAPSVVGEEDSEGETCYVIMGKIEGDPWMFWIGKKTYLLRKIRTLYSFGSFHGKVQPGTGKILLAEEIHRNIRVNRRIPKETFQFKPLLRPNDLDLTTGFRSYRNFRVIL